MHLHRNDVLHSGHAYPVDYLRIFEKRVAVHQIDFDIFILGFTDIVTAPEAHYRAGIGAVIIREARPQEHFKCPEIEAPVLCIGEKVDVVRFSVPITKTQVRTSDKAERAEQFLLHQNAERFPQ